MIQISFVQSSSFRSVWLCYPAGLEDCPQRTGHNVPTVSIGTPSYYNLRGFPKVQLRYVYHILCMYFLTGITFRRTVQLHVSERKPHRQPRTLAAPCHTQALPALTGTTLRNTDRQHSQEVLVGILSTVRDFPCTTHEKFWHWTLCFGI
jgi:hypothetical protein